MKQASGQSLQEGKEPMSFAVYRVLCGKLLRSEASDALFAHTYLVLEWNLMSRAHIVGDMDVAHIEWRLPCILFGEVERKPGRVRIHKDHFMFIPVLRIQRSARYLLWQLILLPIRMWWMVSFALVLHNTVVSWTLFIKRLMTMRTNSKSWVSRKVNLGSHSARKGAVTLLTTGCTVVPPMASVCIRAGWSIGPAKD